MFKISVKRKIVLFFLKLNFLNKKIDVLEKNKEKKKHFKNIKLRYPKFEKEFKKIALKEA